jgi:hypothetical protein
MSESAPPLRKLTKEERAQRRLVGNIVMASLGMVILLAALALLLWLGR